MVIQRVDRQDALQPHRRVGLNQPRPATVDPARIDEAGDVRGPEAPEAWVDRDDVQGENQTNTPPETRDQRFRGIGTQQLRAEQLERPAVGTMSDAPHVHDSEHVHAHGDLLAQQVGRRGRGRRRNRANRPLDYDTSAYRLSALNVPRTARARAALRTRLAGQLDRAYGRGNWQINGAARGSAEELRAMNALAEYGRAQNNQGQAVNHRNTESDLLVPGHNGAATMRMTTQMNNAGRITASVHAARGQPTPARNFATVAAATQALQRDFGVTVAPRNARNANSRAFTAAELSQVHHAFSQMNAAERAAIRGVQLRREAVGGGNHTAGLYSSNVAVRNGRRVAPPSITLYNRAFTSNSRGFVGSAAQAHQQSVQTILHEAGHAIANHRRQAAQVNVNRAVETRNNANRQLQAADRNWNPDRIAMNGAARTFVRTANRTRQTRTQRRATRTFNNAANRVIRATGQVANARTPAQLTRAQAALRTARAQRDRALTAMGNTHPLHAAATTYTAAQNQAAGSAPTRGQRHVAFQQAEGARRQATRALARVETGGRSRRLASFERAARRDTPPTEYGRTSPAENFAESYSLFRSDPEYLRQHRPNIFRWFQRNNHTR